VKECVHFYSNYHSVRTIRDDLVMRLHTRPSESQLKDISKEFADIAVGDGGFRLSAPLPMEFDEPALDSLTRLIFRFNRKDHGRLRMLIDRLNDMA
jgi:hypothetical protein